MKKIIFSIVLLMVLSAFNLKADEFGGSINVIQHAYCDCDGTIEYYINQYCPVGFPNTIPYRVMLWDDDLNDYIELASGTYQKGNSLTGTITELCPGEYELKVEVNGSLGGDQNWIYTSFETLTVNGPDEFLELNLISWGQQYHACYGTGFIQYEVTGGTEPISIQWEKDGSPFEPEYPTNNYHANLEGGTYTVTVTDANGCTESFTVTIPEQYDEITYVLSKQDCGCDPENEKGVIMVSNFSGCENPELRVDDREYDLFEDGVYYWFNWDPGTYPFKAICRHEYAICIETDDITINAIEPPLEVTYSIYGPGCHSPISKGSITLEILSGTPPYQYEWSHDPSNNTNIADNLEADTYTVTVTDANGCEEELDIQLNLVPVFDYDLIVKDIHYGDGDCWKSRAEIVFDPETQGLPPYTIVWDPGEDGLMYNEIEGFPATHTVTVTDANGCEYTQSITNHDCMPHYGEIQVGLAPNPADDIINIDLLLSEPKSTVIKIFDYDWSTLRYDSDEGLLMPGSHFFQIDATGYLPGAYFVVLTFDDEDIVNILLIIE